MRDETRTAEPLLVSGMRRHPTGDVRHVPAPPTGACGTSTAGFLRELDEWVAQVRAEALREAANAWTQGVWADAPRRPDRAVERIATAQYVGDWLRARALASAPTEDPA